MRTVSGCGDSSLVVLLSADPNDECVYSSIKKALSHPVHVTGPFSPPFMLCSNRRSREPSRDHGHSCRRRRSIRRR